jgi:hypothetical protein
LAHIYSHPQMLWLPLCAGPYQRGDSGPDRAGSKQDPANGLRKKTLPRTAVNSGKEKGPELLPSGPYNRSLYSATSR